MSKAEMHSHLKGNEDNLQKKARLKLEMVEIEEKCLKTKSNFEKLKTNYLIECLHSKMFWSVNFY